MAPVLSIKIFNVISAKSRLAAATNCSSCFSLRSR